MRRISCTIAVLAAGLALGQTTESRIRDGLAQWTTSPNLRVRLDGSRTHGSTADLFQAYLHCTDIIDAKGRIVPLVEIAEGVNGKMFQRIVADGSNLYSYVYGRKEVQASTYIAEDAPAGDFPNKLGTGLTAVVEGQSSHLVRIYNDLFHASGTQYKPWIPGRTPILMNSMGTYTDPLVALRQYHVNPAVEYVMFTYGDPVIRNVVYEIDKTGTREKVSAIYFAELKRIGSQDQLTDLVFRFENPLRFSDDTFRFVPPSGSRFLTGPKLIP